MLTLPIWSNLDEKMCGGQKWTAERKSRVILFFIRLPQPPYPLLMGFETGAMYEQATTSNELLFKKKSSKH